MSFPRFPSRAPRTGAAEDRGRVISFPDPRPAANGFLNALRRLTPGIVTGAADVDPSLVMTATVVGALYGYSLLWVVILCVPFLLAIFAVAARIGTETRRGLVDLLRANYGIKVALACMVVIVMINMAMIIADLMAVTDALSIILSQPRLFFVAAVAFSIWYILIFRDYHKITHALAFLSLPVFVYLASAIMSGPSWHEVAVRTVIPRVAPDAGYAQAIVALFGSLLTPYVIVWQTSSRSEQAALGGEQPHGAEHHAGTAVTTLLCYSIIVAAATVFYGRGFPDMTMRQAAEALRPAVGSFGPVLFALGILGAGMVALPVLVASMCYSVSEAMGWKSGLSEHPWEAKGFYVMISAALFVAGAANFLHINPVKALYWSQVLAGVLTLPILVFILILSNDRRIMRTTNTLAQNFWIGAAGGGLVAAGLVLLWIKVVG